MLHPASPCSCGYEVATSEETNVIITRLWRNESVGVELVTGVMCSLQSLGRAWLVKIDDDDDDSTPSNSKKVGLIGCSSMCDFPVASGSTRLGPTSTEFLSG